MHIYTKSGDKGETGLLGGKRISKSSLRIETIGSVDELNAALGALRAPSEIKSQKSKVKMKDQNKKREEKDRLFEKIQGDLFIIGMELADPARQVSASIINESHAQFLEKYIDMLEKKLPKLKNFILPAGTPFAAHAHLARAICRRAERTVVTLHKKESINKHMIIYLNRLSDLLFMLAREDLYDKKIKEALWHI